MSSAAPSFWATVVDVASAGLGIAAAYLMSRRYTTSPFAFLGFPLLAPLMFVLGKGKNVRAYYRERLLLNPEVPVAQSRMAVGLVLLCWAFFLQLLGILLD